MPSRWRIDRARFGRSQAGKLAKEPERSGVKVGIPLESTAVGKCYATEIGQVRRILEIKDGRLKYESRGKTAHGGSWGGGGPP
jgi:hypothetical protein